MTLSEPEKVGKKPIINLSRVDLPTPLGPTMAISFFVGNAKSSGLSKQTPSMERESLEASREKLCEVFRKVLPGVFRVAFRKVFSEAFFEWAKDFFEATSFNFLWCAIFLATPWLIVFFAKQELSRLHCDKKLFHRN